MIVFIVIFVKIICVQSVSTQINFVTKDYFEIRMLLLNLSINLFNLDGVADRFVVRNANYFMSQFNRVLYQIFFFDNAIT